MKAFQDVGKCMVMKQAGRQTDNKGLAATLQRLLVVTVVVAHIVDRPLLRLVGRWPSGAKYPLSQLRAQHVCKQLCSSAELPDILCVNCTPVSCLPSIHSLMDRLASVFTEHFVA